MRKLTLRQINPVVRGANYATVNPLKFGPRINYGYQLFYVFSGSGQGSINESNFDLQAGLAALYGPGDMHAFRGGGDGGMTFATIYFSWEELGAECLATGNHNVTELTEEYWRLADPKVSIEKLPDIPFVFQFSVKERLEIETLLYDIGRNFKQSADIFSQFKYKIVLLEIIRELIKFNRSSSGHTEHYIIARFKEYLEKNYSGEINRGIVSRYLGISESYLTALLRKELNTNFTDCLTSIRMRKAIELLQYSNLSVKEISAATGFRDYNYFVARFRRLNAKTPGSFR